MTERFDMQTPTMAPLFVPHDFVVKRLDVDREALTFIFEDDVTYHDGIRELFPGKRSLILRFRLDDPEILAYREKRRRFPKRRISYVECDPRRLPALCGEGTTYISHYVSYSTVIIELWQPGTGTVFLSVGPECVEYEWSE